MDYRFENRELKARVELPLYRALIGELCLNEDLVNYANESFLRETGVLIQPVHIILSSTALCFTLRIRTIEQFYTASGNREQ